MTALRARTTFVAGVNGRKVRVQQGDIRDSSDPVVKGRERLFEDPAALVEQATAAPGERRTVRRPKK